MTGERERAPCKPAWLKVRPPAARPYRATQALLRGLDLHTVCDEARCPNRSECFSRGTATFLIMGDVCTRACRYCSIAHGRPRTLDADEPAQLASAVRAMGLKHVVVTSVDRDDLPDGGAAHFAAVIEALRALDPRPTVEVLTPDFRGDMAAVDTVLAAGPDIYNHNVETVERLYPQVRRQGRYRWALEVVGHVAARAGGMVTKSGLMVGLGESREELQATLDDLEAVNCRVVTIGQYLRPTGREVPVVRYWTPQEFAELDSYGRSIGLEVIAGPFVRSSYHAEEVFLKVRA